MFSFQGTYLSSDLGVYLLPYRSDLYIIPLVQHYVNTFFVTFLTFFYDTQGCVGKESIELTKLSNPIFLAKIYSKAQIHLPF